VVLEVALIDVTPGSAAGFIGAYAVAKDVITAAPGCRTVRMTHGIETPTRFVLLVEWDSVAAHEAFRESPAFAQWRGHIGPFFAGPPHVEHFADV
jgi:heme-degrading monooxygenase HmoA